VVGALLVVTTLLAPVTSVSAVAAAANAPRDGTAALSIFTGQGDDDRRWIGIAGEGGPSTVPGP